MSIEERAAARRKLLAVSRNDVSGQVGRDRRYWSGESERQRVSRVGRVVRERSRVKGI